MTRNELDRLRANWEAAAERAKIRCRSGDTEEPAAVEIDDLGTGHKFRSIEERDRFVEDELRVRREMMRRFADTNPNGLIAQRRTAEMREASTWRALQSCYFGRELRDFDAAEKDVTERAEQVEAFDRARRDDATREVFDTWTDPAADGRNRLLED